MSALRALVVDDEPLARRGLRQLLSGHPDVTVVGECRDGREALRAIEQLAPDLVLLDVQMPDLDGFDVIRLRGADRMPSVVFVTAYDAFAVQAFEACALDYLVKPVGAERFRAALDKVRRRLRLDDALALAARLTKLLAADDARRRPTETTRPHPEAAAGRILVPTERGKRLLDQHEVDWIGARDYYAEIHAGKHRYLVRESLSGLEAQLDPAHFFRVHRNAIVRLDRVRELAAGPRADLAVVLRDGTRVPVSRRRKERLQALLRPRPRQPALPPGPGPAYLPRSPDRSRRGADVHG